MLFSNFKDEWGILLDSYLEDSQFIAGIRDFYGVWCLDSKSALRLWRREPIEGSRWLVFILISFAIETWKIVCWEITCEFIVCRTWPFLVNFEDWFNYA